jgi:hypothetical protein
MAKADPPITKIPRGFGRGHKVTAAGGGRETVGNQLAKEERQALWLDPDTGEWRPFSEGVPQFDPRSFRLPSYDSIFETGLFYRMQRPPVRTYRGLDWSKSQFNNFPVVISILPSDKPLSAAASPRPNLPPPPAITAKEARRLRPVDWIAHIPTRFPEKPEQETRKEYLDRIWARMCKELKERAWSRTTFEQQCYAQKALQLRQPRNPRQPSAKPR